ncbi:MAG: hypothetical protein ACI4V7_03000 [Succinivibrionaceae bacterium]
MLKNIISSFKLLLTYLLIISFCEGCSVLGIGDSEFGCNGIPDKKSCKSAREVYLNRNNIFKINEVSPSLSELNSNKHVVVTIVEPYVDDENRVHERQIIKGYISLEDINYSSEK